METLVHALSVILPLVVLESLLSVDNAIVLAAMVSHLPKHQQQRALWWGMILAYLTRGLSLFCISWLYAYPSLKLIGGAYLLYLMSSNLGKSGSEEKEAKGANGYGLAGTIGMLGLADITFSIDNIFAAAAFSQNFWFVCLGVFIGIAAIRLVAGWFVKLIEELPILADIAYVLVGAIGLQLIAEHVFRVDLSEVQKFMMILAIIGCGLCYDKLPFVNSVLSPVFNLCALFMGKFAAIVEWPFKGCFRSLPLE